MTEEWDAGTIAFAHRVFDLARSGATGGSTSALETAAFSDLPEMTEPPRAG